MYRYGVTKIFNNRSQSAAKHSERRITSLFPELPAHHGAQPARGNPGEAGRARGLPAVGTAGPPGHPSQHGGPVTRQRWDEGNHGTRALPWQPPGPGMRAARGARRRPGAPIRPGVQGGACRAPAASPIERGRGAAMPRAPLRAAPSRAPPSRAGHAAAPSPAPPEAPRRPDPPELSGRSGAERCGLSVPAAPGGGGGSRSGAVCARSGAAAQRGAGRAGPGGAGAAPAAGGGAAGEPGGAGGGEGQAELRRRVAAGSGTQRAGGSPPPPRTCLAPFAQLQLGSGRVRFLGGGGRGEV